MMARESRDGSRRVARALVGLALAVASPGCATYWQAERIEAKLDEHRASTNRAALVQLFGERADDVVGRIEALDEGRRAQLDSLLASYQSGAGTLDEVRRGMARLLGGGEREVTSARGVWLRDEGGVKVRAVARGTRILDCRRLGPDELPEPVRTSPALQRYGWGVGRIEGRAVVFPWELTMSSFTREIVENAARRTAEELLRLTDERGWSRPVHIQVTTDPAGKGFTISTPGEENEIYVHTEPGATASGEPAPGRPGGAGAPRPAPSP